MYAQKKIAWGIDEISIFNNNSEIIFRYSWDDAESNTGNIITFIDKVISFLSGNIDFKEAIQMALINNEGEKVSITYNPQVIPDEIFYVDRFNDNIHFGRDNYSKFIHENMPTKEVLNFIFNTRNILKSIQIPSSKLLNKYQTKKYKSLICVKEFFNRFIGQWNKKYLIKFKDKLIINLKELDEESEELISCLISASLLVLTRSGLGTILINDIILNKLNNRLKEYFSLIIYQSSISSICFKH